MKTIELPCLAGDYIYAVGPQYKFYHPKAFEDCEYEVDKYYVRSIHLNDGILKNGHGGKDYISISYGPAYRCSGRYYLEDFGKTVFTTKEEAQAIVDRLNKEEKHETN